VISNLLWSFNIFYEGYCSTTLKVAKWKPVRTKTTPPALSSKAELIFTLVYEPLLRVSELAFWAETCHISHFTLNSNNCINLKLIKVIVKLYFVFFMNVYWGSWVIVPLILRGNSHRFPPNRRQGKPHGQSGRYGEEKKYCLWRRSKRDYFVVRP
jgi:hypothetical protein